jgi:elongation factor G
MSHPPGDVHPILSILINTATDEERDKISQELAVLVQHDPTLRVEVGSFEGQLIINGEDEVELETLGKKVLLAHRAEIGELKINFRETVRKSAEAEGRYIRQIGGSGNYGHCKLRIEPNWPGSGYEFINDIKDGVVPKEYIKAIDQGVQGAMESGILSGFPVIDLKVTLFDGSYHEVDSNEMAFRIAGTLAFKEATRNASPVLMEPMMAVEVTVPNEFTETIIADINSRRGRIDGMERAARAQTICATIPLAEVLRSSAHGRPQYAMRFAGYEAVPPQDGPYGDDAAAYATKPRGPRRGDGSAAAEREP